jgi:hypothetical protein
MYFIVFKKQPPDCLLFVVRQFWIWSRQGRAENPAPNLRHRSIGQTEPDRRLEGDEFDFLVRPLRASARRHGSVV